MIITARLRRMILQRSQRGFIEVRYFTGLYAYPECGRADDTRSRKPPEDGNLQTLPHRCP